MKIPACRVLRKFSTHRVAVKKIHRCIVPHNYSSLLYNNTVAFPVWTKETLALDQAFKREILKTRQEYMVEKEAALEKMQASNNPIQRAFLYRDAAAAVEKTLMLPPFSHIPEDEDVITLANGLVVSKEGNLYKSVGTFGFGKKLLGTASISFVDNNDA